MKHVRFIAMMLFLVMLTFMACGGDGGGEDASVTVINIFAIPGVTPPNYGETPVTAITETAQYTGTVSWSPSDATFAVTTVYTATITLTAKPGYTLTGVAENFFTVVGATSVTNSIDSGVVTAVFPETGKAPGDKETFTADGVAFEMAFVPGGRTFPIEIDDSVIATVANAYWIGETEVTYELWEKVYVWATDVARGANQYSFANAGQKGNDGAVDKTIQHPVTMINWRDATIWCNALTEWYNANNGTATDLDCVYYTDSGYTLPIRSADNTTSIDNTAGSQNNPYVKATAKGFRLLTSNEWELAARWRNDATNTVSGYENPWFTKGNSASGATADIYDAEASGLVAVYNVSSTAVVKSKTSGYNALGLYDMSGNVWEWCSDLTTGTGSARVLKGGSWDMIDCAEIGFWYEFRPYFEFNYTGFRFARTH